MKVFRARVKALKRERKYSEVYIAYMFVCVGMYRVCLVVLERVQTSDYLCVGLCNRRFSRVCVSDITVHLNTVITISSYIFQ